MATRKNELLIRFRGICAHIQIGKTKRKRTILIRHPKDNSRIEHHMAYVEFYADDVDDFSRELTLLRYTRPGVDGTFARVDLEVPTEIRLKGIEAGDVEESLSYERDLPHMEEILKGHKVAEQLLTPKPSDVDRSRAIGVFDMPAGRLVAGEPEPQLTRFPKDVAFEERRLARWTDLTITFEAPLTLQLTPLGATRSREIVFKKSIRMLTIGNEPERLILGVMRPGRDLMNGIGHTAHGSSAAPIQPTGHFILYYDVLENPPDEKQRPVPIPTQLEGAGCPNNAYP